MTKTQRSHLYTSVSAVDIQAFLGLGLPGTIAVSVCLTGEDATIRDSDPGNSGALKRARGAVLCRAAPSFLRFGSFELPARRGDVELVRKLADYCVRHLGPCLGPSRLVDGEDIADDRKRTTGHPVPARKGQEVKLNDGEDPRENYLRLLVAIVEVGPTSLDMGICLALTITRALTREDTFKPTCSTAPLSSVGCMH